MGICREKIANEQRRVDPLTADLTTGEWSRGETAIEQTRGGCSRARWLVRSRRPTCVALQLGG